MYQNKGVLAVIPARGGSRGVPGKNIRLLDGKPLISHTIGHALNSKLIDRVVVSTEDDEIAQVSKKFGAEVIKRPCELSRDDTSTEDVLRHVVVHLKWKEGYLPDIIVLLQCTSPLREKDDIDNAIKKMVESGADSLLSVCKNNSFLWKEENNLFIPINYDYRLRPRRQDMQQFLENGSIYIFKRGMFIEERNRLCGTIQVYVMKVENSFEIDTEFDFLLIEQIIRWRNEKGENR